MPFDVLICHLAIPPILAYARPQNKARRVWTWYWRVATRAFSLTYLFYGEQEAAMLQRQYTGPEWLEKLWEFIDPILQVALGEYDSDETRARVPSADRVALLPADERRKDGVFVPLNRKGAPKTDTGKLVLLKQNRVAFEAKRDPKKDYTIVWLPRYWRTRIHLFMLHMMLMMGALFAGAFFGPILVGRGVFGMVTDRPVYDGNSYVSHLRASHAPR